jgi:hypothetical protein
MHGRFLALLCTMLLLAVASCTSTGPSNEVSHYRIDVKLDPSSGLIDASVDLSIQSVSEGSSTVVFHLHRQLQVDTVHGSLVTDYELDLDPVNHLPWMPEAGELSVNLVRPLVEGERIDLHFEYHGNVDTWPEWSANVITGDWTEIGLYLPWFPYNYNDYGLFTYELDVIIDDEYVVRGLGDAERIDGGWHLEWNQPTNDVVVVASRDLRSVRVDGEGQTVQVHFTILDDSVAVRIGEDVITMLRTYASWFGESDQASLSLVESKRARGGGYARRSLIVLGQLSVVTAPEERANYMRYLAHEAVHGWWNRAPADGWDDWLNESFAEYSALLVIRDQLGDAEFTARLDEKRRASEGTPAIWHLARSDVSTEEKARGVNQVLYSKGPILLDELADRVGLAAFLDWCRRLVQLEIGSTEEALDVLADLEGEPTSRWFRHLLMTR